MVRQSSNSYLGNKIVDTLNDICEENKNSKSNKVRASTIENTSFTSINKFTGSPVNNSYHHDITSNRCVQEKKSLQLKINNERFDKNDSSGDYSRQEKIAEFMAKEGESVLDIQSISKQVDNMVLSSATNASQTRRRKQRNYPKKYKLNYDYSNYPKVNKSYLSSLSKFPERYITERCVCNGEDSCSYYFLRGTSMKECHCRSHHRFIPNNIRVKMQNAIIQHIIKHFIDKPVRIMSLGAGAFLQDLMIILKLAEAGINAVDIALVEPNPCLKAYPDFKYFVNKIRVIYKMKYISVKTYLDINEVDPNDQFDIIYAIDYDECNSKDYLHEHRHIEIHNNETPSLNPDKATWDLIKVSKFLAFEDHGLIIVSKLKHILHMTPGNLPFYGMP